MSRQISRDKKPQKERVKTKKTKNFFKKKQKIFSLVFCLSFSQLSRHFHQLFFSFEKKKKKKLKKKTKKKKEKTKTKKNHKTTHLFVSNHTF